MYNQIKLPIENELKKPIIKNFICEHRRVAGFIHEDGTFEEEREIKKEADIDDFMDMYDVSFVMILRVE